MFSGIFDDDDDDDDDNKKEKNPKKHSACIQDNEIDHIRLKQNIPGIFHFSSHDSQMSIIRSMQ